MSNKIQNTPVCMYLANSDVLTMEMDIFSEKLSKPICVNANMACLALLFVIGRDENPWTPEVA